MENYGYLDKEELTSYDRYVLNKKDRAEATPSYSSGNNKTTAKVQNDNCNTRECKKYNEDFEFKQENVVEKNEEKRRYNAYDKYMFKELSRTAPTEGKVMTREEFYSSSVAKPHIKAKLFGKMFNNVNFKKGGKLILILYVIIVIALASILIVANTTDIASNESANATVNTTQAEKSLVSSMTIEEETEESNWFDRLCDAMNK